MCQLYEDLRTTDVKDLLDISKPAFKFVDEKQFEKCIKWDKEILESINVYVNLYKDKVINVLLFSQLIEKVNLSIFINKTCI